MTVFVLSLFHGTVPTMFRLEALNTATHTLNRSPCRPRNDATPYQLLYGHMPSYNHLRMFGCQCYPNLSATAAHKLSPRSVACVFLGYPIDTMSISTRMFSHSDPRIREWPLRCRRHYRIPRPATTTSPFSLYAVSRHDGHLLHWPGTAARTLDAPGGHRAAAIVHSGTARPSEAAAGATVLSPGASAPCAAGTSSPVRAAVLNVAKGILTRRRAYNAVPNHFPDTRSDPAGAPTAVTTTPSTPTPAWEIRVGSFAWFGSVTTWAARAIVYCQFLYSINKTCYLI
jgi:hypothetical protein